MKTFTNNAPGMRGIRVREGDGEVVRYLDPGQSIEIDPTTIVGALPDLGKPRHGGATAEDGSVAQIALLKSENARLTARVSELEARLSGKEEPDADLIKAAIEGLDAKNDEHWTAAGLPEVKAVKAALGSDVTRAQIEAAAPEAKRPAA